MSWLITGGCGFIGTALIHHLLKIGFKNIRVIDNLEAGSRSNLSKITDFTELKPEHLLPKPKGVELVVGDVCDISLAKLVVKGCKYIVHLAANTGVTPSVKNPRLDCKVNVIGTLNYLDAARSNNVCRFIFASSGAPIGQVNPPIHEEIAPHPASPYGASKLAGEGYCSAYHKTFDLDTVVLRFGNVYGVGSKHKNSVIAKFIKLALEGKTLEIYGEGTQTRDFIYIEDLIEAIILSSTTKDIGGEIFQIATSKETSLLELLGNIKNIFNTMGLLKVNYIHKGKRVGDVQRNFSDNSKARKVLLWKPKVSLKNGLIKTIQYFHGKG